MTRPTRKTSIGAVKSNKRVLVVYDGTKSLSVAVAALLDGLKGTHCVVKSAQDLVPTDILPADTFFFGCEAPHPSSFSELERVLKGINLAGRTCGFFTLASDEAIGYLRSIVRDADLLPHPAPFYASGKADIGAWAAETLRLR